MANSKFVRPGSDSSMVLIFVAFAAVAIWSTVPLTIRLLTTLKRRSGLYFWSLLATSWGLSIRQIGLLTSFLAPQCPWTLSLCLAQAGWVAMVSGFSMVIYSRLNIIVENRRIRRFALAMIVFNGVVWHIAMTTLSAGIARERNTGHRERIPAWQRIHDPLERVQIVMFSAQETIISFFYVRAAYQYLKNRFAQQDKTRSAMFLLLLVQVIIVAVDIALIVIDFAGYLQLKLFIHSFVYSVKLELEFVVLNQLVELSRMGIAGIPSFSFDVAPSSKMDRSVTAEAKHPGLVELMLPFPSVTLDLESQRSRGSKTSRCSLDFITTPDCINSR
ncbi:hypothetical protein BKA66DRAFT_441678 [Pyrenochaeta sp. MPI-SDFR-AT-0127]|nr:hypothetical protein BKA66DRAFT_441678 [Pyrenochaeta sp. MPI-SDFR-AT-0127]